MMKRKLAPYSRQVAARISDLEKRRAALGTSADARAVTLWVVAGPDAWDMVARRPKWLALPCDGRSDPFIYDWSIVRGHAPVLLVRAGKCEGDMILRLVQALLRDGAERVIDMRDGTRYVPRRVAA